MTIMSRILKRFTISGHKVNIELHGSLSSPVISKRSTIKKILNILLLRQKESLRRGGDLNLKKVPQRTKIRHKKLITKTSFDKSNILRVINSDDHIAHVKKEKNPTMRWHVDKETSATILNIANIRIKNNTTVMVSDLPNRYELHGQIRNKRNIRDMKRVRRKSALPSYRKRGSIDSMNNAMARRRS
jgi:hypothetical protein